METTVRRPIRERRPDFRTRKIFLTRVRLDFTGFNSDGGDKSCLRRSDRYENHDVFHVWTTWRTRVCVQTTAGHRYAAAISRRIRTDDGRRYLRLCAGRVGSVVLVFALRKYNINVHTCIVANRFRPYTVTSRRRVAGRMYRSGDRLQYAENALVVCCLLCLRRLQLRCCAPLYGRERALDRSIENYCPADLSLGTHRSGSRCKTIAFIITIVVVCRIDQRYSTFFSPCPLFFVR